MLTVSDSAFNYIHESQTFLKEEKMQNGAIEIGMFKLKQGVQLEDVLHAYQNMIKHFLSNQTDWQAQSLILLENDTLIDIAWAKNIEASKHICSLWEKNEECLAFLELIEPLSMQFGKVITSLQ